MKIFEGYPHTTSVLRQNENTGKYFIERILDYDGIDQSTIITDYVDEFVRGCSGLYIKWLNTQSGYSYWLFSPRFKTSRKVKTLGEIQNHWRTRGLGDTNNIEIGKYSQDSIKCFTKAHTKYMNEIISITESPEVYLYTDDAVNCEKFTDNLCGWMRVSINDGNYQTQNSKYNFQELSLTLKLPKRFVQSII